MTYHWQRFDCTFCDGAGGQASAYHDEDGFEVSDWHRCPPCGGSGVKERQSGGGHLPVLAASLSDVTPFDVRRNQMERSSEEALRRLER